MKKRILILLMLFMSMSIYAGSMEKKGNIVIVTDDFSKQVIIDPMNPNLVIYKGSMINEIFIDYNGIKIMVYKNGLSIEEVYEFLYNGEGKFDNSIIKITLKKS
jgi:hypothetical protein